MELQLVVCLERSFVSINWSKVLLWGGFCGDTGILSSVRGKKDTAIELLHL